MNKMYLKLIGMGIGLTMVVSIASALGIMLELSENGILFVQIVAFSFLAIALSIFMFKKDKSLKKFGFCRTSVNKIVVRFISIIILVQPLILGINASISVVTIILITIQMSLVGFVEESLFRGIFFYYLEENTKVYVLFSSIVFGLLHAASGINPEFPIILTVLQVVNALLLGVVFALLYLSTKSIYPTMIFHGLFNFLASVLLSDSIEKTVIAVLILLVLYVIFIWYLVSLESNNSVQI